MNSTTLDANGTLEQAPQHLPGARESLIARGTAKILILDGYSTRTLACVRSWGKRGIAFAVGGETRWDMSLHSQYVREKFVYTSPKRSVQGFVQDINRYAAEFGADCVFPTSEAAILACHKHRDRLSCAPIIPAPRDIHFAFSKANTLAAAESLSIFTPKTRRITSHNLAEIDSIDLDFPIVVKSECSESIASGSALTSKKTSYASSRAELKKECCVRIAQGQAVLLQEFIDGYGVGVSGLFDGGEPVVLIAHRRIRESNPCGGPSCVAETIQLQDALVEPTTSLLKQIGFTGPAMVEYKIDRRTERPYLMEINGRLWGTILLGAAAGIDIPYLYWKMLNGVSIPAEEKDYAVGIRGRYIVGDTKCLFLSLKGRPKNWPGRMASRTQAVEEYLQSFFDRSTTELIFGWDDPLPFFARLIQRNS